MIHQRQATLAASSVIWLLLLEICSYSAYGFAPILHLGHCALTCQKTSREHGRLFQWDSAASSSRWSTSSSIDPIASAQALNELVPRSKITPLIQSKSNIQGALQLAFHAGVFSVAAMAHYFSHSILSIVAMAFVSSFFFHGLHETVHRTAFRSKWLNDVVAHMFGLLCLRPARHYYHYHWQHHRYTGNVKLDSELQAGSFLDLPVTSLGRYLFYLSGIPFWIDALSSIVRHAAGNCGRELYLQSSTKAQKEVAVEARAYLSLYLALVAAALQNGSVRSLLLQYWLLPAVLGQPLLRFYLLAEHRGRLQSELIVENTRTMANTNWFYRKLAWNMPYHMEHHAWPAVPFYKLADARALLVNATATGTDTDTDTDSNDSNNDVLNRGELILPSNDAGNPPSTKGYIAFHRAFLKNLLHEKRISNA